MAKTLSSADKSIEHRKFKTIKVFSLCPEKDAMGKFSEKLLALSEHCLLLSHFPLHAQTFYY